MSTREPGASREFSVDSGFIRLEIGDAWTAFEMSALLSDVSRLYDIRRGLDMPPEERRSALFDPWSFGWWGILDLQSPSPRLPGPPLGVVRVRYESPGFVDLIGLGKTVEQVRIFLQYLIDLGVQHRMRGLEADSLEQDVIAKKIENAERLLDFRARARRESDLNPEEARRLLLEVDDRQTRILDAVIDGRVNDVRELPGPELLDEPDESDEPKG